MFDDEYCFRAIQSRDPRFDGWFYTAVTTTGIYCRPSCPATTPKRANVKFFTSSAAAHGAGFRACKRCRPDASPGSPEWNQRADIVGRAMRLIADGVVDRGGVATLADSLGYSERHLNRLLTSEVGAGPIALARAQRAQTARILLETTDLPITNVSFAAGFASVRQFNDTVQEVFALSPTALRSSKRLPDEPGTPGAIKLRLPYRSPFAGDALFSFLAVRAVPGVETGDSTSYTRTLSLPRGAGSVHLKAADRHIECTLRLDDLRDLTAAIQRCRRLLDLDADPCAVDQQLESDPLIAHLVRRRPGLRSPGHVDPHEAAIRAVLGQQVSVASARATAARIAFTYGQTLEEPVGTLTHRFPTAGRLAGVDPTELPATRFRARAVVNLAQALVDGKIVLDPGANRDEVQAKLQELPGIGPWTASYIRLRSLGDPDVFMHSDLGIRRALERLGVDGGPRSAELIGQRFRPWRSYVLHHLWTSLSDERIGP